MRVYLDNAATTRISEAAKQAMTPFWDEIYGNPSSLHTFGQAASNALQLARESIAKNLNASPQEIYFTSGGSEADNQAIFSAARLGAKRGKKHLITSAIEHHAVLHPMMALRDGGFELTILPVQPETGFVRVDDLAAALRDDTALVSIMLANNEVGTIQPIAEMTALCRARKIPFHTDAVQAVGHIPVDVRALNADTLSLSGHKFHGPKGIGALYCRKGHPLQAYLLGGAQERNRRAGTENLPAIAGMAAALREAVDDIAETAAHMTSLRDQLIAGLRQIDRSHLNGDPMHRLPGNVNFCFEGIEGEALLLLLDTKGIAGSSGSACTSGSLEPSHVLLALGRPHEIAHGSLRLSLSRHTTQEEVDYTLAQIYGIVDYLRKMSPVWERIMAEKN
ncbi:MAG: cysteine desulfurase [Oscillospiraceae bacterium]|jgi:cysteine desulfurase|nr:cysteine desulfurase [Oscillospiraceae bacterium]